MESQAGQDFLGVELDSRQGYKGKVTPAEFKKGFGRVVTDVAEGHVTSRDLNDHKSIKKYLLNIEHLKPKRSKRGSFKPSDIIKVAPEPTGNAPLTKKKTRPRQPSTRLIPSDLQCGVDSQRIHDVFNELRTLSRKVTDFPNATAIMLRVLLELAVSHYIQRSGKTQDMLGKCNKKHKHPPDWHPSLRQQLSFMVDEMTLPLEPLELKAIKPFIKDKQTPMTLDTLDGFVHNKQNQPTETELRAIWAKIEPLLRIVLSAPQQPSN